MKPAANGPLRAAPLPANEAERLRELHALDLFNADRIDQTKQVERICRLARDLFDVPAALVTLLDRDRARFVTTPDFKLADIPRSEAICSHTILAEAPLVIPDALAGMTGRTGVWPPVLVFGIRYSAVQSAWGSSGEEQAGTGRGRLRLVKSAGEKA